MKNKGFTIFFAMLVASLALAVGLSIYDLLVRELALSQAATQSQQAIYAADTGVECAYYWDSKFGGAGSAFATSSTTTPPPPTSGVTCITQANGFGQDIAAQGTPGATFDVPPGSGATAWGPWVITTSGATTTTTFTILLGTNATNPCALVTVAKSGNPSQTTVKSRGYNTCTIETGVRLERALRVTY